MLGKIIEKIRTDRKMTKKELCEKTNINPGHMTHIEKDERTPSHKMLTQICDGLNVPYSPIFDYYDHKITEEQISYYAANHVNYSSVPEYDSFKAYVPCPEEYREATCVLTIQDDAMSPKFNKGDRVFVQTNVPLNNKDNALIVYKDKVLFRRFIVRKNDIVLRAQNSKYEEIILNRNTKFYMYGKVLGKVEK